MANAPKQQNSKTRSLVSASLAPPVGLRERSFSAARRHRLPPGDDPRHRPRPCRSRLSAAGQASSSTRRAEPPCRSPCTNLNASGDKAQDATRFWFDTRANLRREMEDRKRRFDDKDRSTRQEIAEAVKPHCRKRRAL